MVSIKHIADLAGVSYSTVSKALNDSPLVKPETKRRIVEIARSQGYQRNLLASHLVSGRTRLIGLALVNLGNPIFANMARHLHASLHAKGYRMILAIAPEEVEILSQLRVEGLIIWGDLVTRYPHVLQELKNWSTQYFILGADDMLDVPHVRFDRKAGIAEAVRYLQSYGHKRIGFVGSSQEIKVRAFMEALTAAGLEVSSDCLFPAEPTWEGGYQSLRYARADRVFPTAFIGLNNLVTKGALRALLEMQYAVPGDISIIGYDNLPDMQFAEVPTTTVGPILEEVADMSADFMVSLIEGTAISSSLTIHPVLIPRSSVGRCTDLLR